jgi:hypothetical protein
MRFFRTDLKRLFAGKALLALCLLAPLLVIGLFSLLVLPMVLSAQSLHINVALLDDDGSETVGMFIHEFVYGQQLAELVSIRSVQSLEEGSRLVAQNEVSVLVHIPAGLFEAVRGQDTVEIRLISSAPHALEASLVAMSLEQSLRYVGQGQNQLDLARQILIEQQVDTSAADGFLEQTTRLVLLGYMNRQGLIGSDGAVSPLGDFLPVEYYLVAVYVFFAALAMLPLVHLTAHALNGAILQRGLLQGAAAPGADLVRPGDHDRRLGRARFGRLVELLLPDSPDGGQRRAVCSGWAFARSRCRDRALVPPARWPAPFSQRPVRLPGNRFPA